jgi:hypothetical protein
MEHLVVQPVHPAGNLVVQGERAPDDRSASAQQPGRTLGHERPGDQYDPGAACRDRILELRVEPTESSRLWPLEHKHAVPSQAEFRKQITLHERRFLGGMDDDEVTATTDHGSPS